MIAWLKSEWNKAWTTHRKWGVALLMFLTTLVTSDLVHGSALRWTNISIAALTAVGVRAVANGE